MLLLFIFVSLVAFAQVTDFTLATRGPHHVVQGHYLFFSVTGKVLAGTDVSGTVPSLSGLPAGATGEFVGMARYCCVTYLYRVEGDNPIKISTSASTPVGAYPVKVTYKTPEGIQRSVMYTIYVDPIPSLIQKTGVYFPASAPLASATQWSTNMVTHGQQHCTASDAGNYSMYTVGYYDGTRIYYQIADLTGDSSWNTCAGMVYSSYSKYVNSGNGQVPGYQVFPHGLAMRFQRTGDAAALQTLTSMQVNGLDTNWPDISYIMDWSSSREVSYGIETNLVYQSVGGAANPHLQDLIEVQIGHFDQWFQSKNAAMVQPFMVALAAEALIQYWDVSHDPRIPPLLQLAADQIWSTSFETSCNCFRYYNDTPVDGTWTASNSDLSLLIAPLYGWVYQQTGAQIYRDQGDQIFNAGVAGAWLDGGKQFAQSYRWSAKYLEWRNSTFNAPMVAITTPTTAPTFNASSPTINLSGTAFDSAGVIQVTWATDRGTSGSATGAANWTISGLALQTGLTTITVTARDAAGNIGSTVLTVNYVPDTVPPAIAITSPTSSQSFSTSGTSINLSGTASDNVGVATVTWATDHGASGTATGTTGWTISGVPVPAGSTQITVTAADAAGNVATAVLAVTSGSAPPPADTIPPAISITTPTSGSVFTASNSTISLSGTASDNVAVAQVSWTTDHGASGIASGTTNWAIGGLTLSSGSTLITVTAVDAAGNLGRSSLAITYTAPDTTPPSVTITTPTSGTTFQTSGTSISVSGIASDNVGVTQITWATDRGASGIATGTTAWSTGGIALVSGSTQITVTAYDKAGNQASALLAVTLPPQPDTTPPTIIITSPQSSPFSSPPGDGLSLSDPTGDYVAPTAALSISTASSSISLSGTATDNVGVLQVFWVSSRGASGVATGTASWNTGGIPLQSGSNVLTVTARDAAGNQSTAVVTVTSTTTDPGSSPPLAVVITSPTSSPVYTTSVDTVRLAGTASSTAGIVQVAWSADRGGGSGVASGTTSWVVNQINLQHGSNTITVSARDATNNLSSQVIRIDYSPPGVKTRSLPKAQAGQQYSYNLDVSGGVPPYSWSASSLPDGMSLSADGLLTGTPVATGTYDVNFVVRDSAVSASTTLTLAVDPWIKLVSPATFSPGWAAPASMLTALGWHLSAGTASAGAGSLPTVLADCTVTVRDAQGTDRLAPLYFVSPDQINFVIPADTSLGTAIVTVSNTGRSIISGTLYVATVAPALFMANAEGLAAANLLRSRADVSEYIPISQLDPATSQVVAVPLDLSPDTDRFYLILYGSGVRLRSGLDSVKATVGGADAQVVYAGSAGAPEGLDVVNVLLPTALHGWADVLITADGVAANTVRILIK